MKINVPNGRGVAVFDVPDANLLGVYESSVNRVAPPDDRTAVLERCLGGWSWQEVARVPMKIEGNALSLTIPRAALGQKDRVDVRFKWADNTPGEKGDILDFYRHGDSAPDGRFLYHYFE